MQTQEFEHIVQGKKFIHYLAYNELIKTKRPAVMVVPAFEGRTNMSCEYAEKLAALGYVGVAIDMYGNKETATTLEGCLNLFKPLAENRGEVRKRITAAFTAIKQLNMVNENNIAIMGFCFGGMVALDLARSGTPIKGAVSFHGGLEAPQGLSEHTITAKVLALHGYDDPHIPPEKVINFANEMTKKNVDWQIVMYGHTKHSFTDPEAHKIAGEEFGRRYSASATKRSWKIAQDFFIEIFDLNNNNLPGCSSTAM